MKYKNALFIANSATDLSDARPLGEWAESLPDQYTRVTEYFDGEYTERPIDEYVGDQIENLRNKQKELRQEAEEKVAQIESLIASLAAIEYKPE